MIEFTVSNENNLKDKLDNYKKLQLNVIEINQVTFPNT